MFKNVKVLFPCLIVLILLLLVVDIQAGYASIPWNELLSSLFAPVSYTHLRAHET